MRTQFFGNALGMEDHPARLATAATATALAPARLPVFGRRDNQRAASPELPYQRHVLRHLRALRRMMWLVLFTPICCLVQTLLLMLPGKSHEGFGKFYWAAVNNALGLSVRVIGQPASRHGPDNSGRRVIYVCNHSSWLDVPALGAKLKACFVAKDEVAGWPGIGTIARLGRTVYVSRTRHKTGHERDTMQDRMALGDDLILFPEGTSSDGARVLPFRSAFFAAAYGEAKPLIQPVSVVYDRLEGLPVGHVSRAVFAWYGDMSLVPHAFSVAQVSGKRVTLLFHTPVDPAHYPDRKALSAAVYAIVADGAATLRQNRPARPLASPGAVSGLKPVADTAQDAAFA